MLEKSLIEQIIKESSEKAQRHRKEYTMFGRIFISIMGELLPTIDMSEIIDKIERSIPPHLFEEIDEIFIGSFTENDERSLEAHYESGAIYMTSDLPMNIDYIENIVHETAHSLEPARGLEIYGDKSIEKEFLGKRRRLASTLKSHGIKTLHLDFEEPEYAPEFDSFLYKDIGYANLTSMTMGLFASPYGATSLSEYFSNGFEEFFLGNREHLKRISPRLFIKIMEIVNNDI
jgi:hypothetical protein